MGWQYYVMRGALLFWVLSIVATSPLQINAQIPHTHTFGNTYGPLYSERYTSRQAVALALSSTRLWQFLVVCALITFRRTTLGGYPALQTGLLVTLAALVTLDAMSLSINSAFLHQCNDPAPDNRGNPCNARNRCCASAVYGNSANGCRNTGPCQAGTAVSSVRELSRSIDFKWTFALNVLYVAAGLAVLALASWVVLRNMATETRERKVVLEQGEQRMMEAEADALDGVRKRK